MAEATAPAEAGNEKGRGPKDEIKVTVTFPLGHGPYRADHASGTTLGAVRAAAMAHFEVTEDPALRFYLIHDGLEVSDTQALGDVAGPAAAVKFTLARDIVQG